MDNQPIFIMLRCLECVWGFFIFWNFFCQFKDLCNQQNLSHMVLVLYPPNFSFNGQSNARGEVMQQCLTYIYYWIVRSRLHWSSCACCTSIKLFLQVHCDTSRCFRVICKEICHVISENVWRVFFEAVSLLNDSTLCEKWVDRLIFHVKVQAAALPFLPFWFI